MVVTRSWRSKSRCDSSSHPAMARRSFLSYSCVAEQRREDALPIGGADIPVCPLRKADRNVCPTVSEPRRAHECALAQVGRRDSVARYLWIPWNCPGRTMLTARDDEGRGGSCRRGNGATDDLSRRGRGTAARGRGGLSAAPIDSQH